MCDDILVSADGTWPRVRVSMRNLDPREAGPMFPTKHSRYSGYTCSPEHANTHPSTSRRWRTYNVFLGRMSALDDAHEQFALDSV